MRRNRTLPHLLGVPGADSRNEPTMSRLGRIFRFVLLTAFIAWFGYEILRFPIRVELKAVIILGLAVLVYIAIGEVAGLTRR